MDPREANEVIQAEYKRIRKLRVRNVVLIVLVVVLAAIPVFFYFRMATQAHLTFREAKNIKLATNMLAVEYYGTGETLFDPTSPDGMTDRVRERLLSVTQSNGNLRLLAYDKAERAVTAFTYESGHVKVTYRMTKSGREDWTVDYVIRYAEYTTGDD